MEGLILVSALLFGGITLWGARGMLQVIRKRNECAGEADVMPANGGIQCVQSPGHRTTPV